MQLFPDGLDPDSESHRSSYAQQLSEQAALWRDFNRYYFHRLRTLQFGNESLSLHATQLRVLREIGEAPDGIHNAYIAWIINVRKGQVSRIVDGFRDRGWVEEQRNALDRRVKSLSLTPSGRDAFRALENRDNDATELFLSRMIWEDRLRLLAALQEVRRLISAQVY